MENPNTADGERITLGMRIYVVSTDTGNQCVYERTVYAIYQFKVLFLPEEVGDGYIGSRINAVYAKKENAEKALREHKPYWPEN
jgi:hypothetical protein